MYCADKATPLGSNGTAKPATKSTGHDGEEPTISNTGVSKPRESRRLSE